MINHLARCVLGFALMIVALSFTACADDKKADDTGVVSVQLVDDEGKDYEGGALQIDLVEAGTDKVAATVKTREAKLTFKGVKPGKYQVRTVTLRLYGGGKEYSISADPVNVEIKAAETATAKVVLKFKKG